MRKGIGILKSDFHPSSTTPELGGKHFNDGSSSHSSDVKLSYRNNIQTNNLDSYPPELVENCIKTSSVITVRKTRKEPRIGR